MATPICNALVRNILTGVVLALGVSTLIASDVIAQESRRPGGGEGRQMDGGGRGAGGPGARGDGADSERPAGEGRRAGGRQADAADQSNAPPMQFDTSPVKNAAAPPVAVPAPQPNGWLNDLADMDARLTLLEKRRELDERMLDSQITLMEKRAELDAMTRGGLDVKLLDTQIQTQQKRAELDGLVRESTSATLAYLPSVVAIMGTQGKYRSQLYFPSGRISYAREGDLIAPGVRVTSISPSGIEVSMVLGNSNQPQQVPLNFVSLPERRGENEEAAGGDAQQGWVPPWLRGAMGMGGGGARPMPAAGAAR